MTASNRRDGAPTSDATDDEEDDSLLDRAASAGLELLGTVADAVLDAL